MAFPTSISHISHKRGPHIPGQQRRAGKIATFLTSPTLANFLASGTQDMISFASANQVSLLNSASFHAEERKRKSWRWVSSSPTVKNRGDFMSEGVGIASHFYRDHLRLVPFKAARRVKYVHKRGERDIDGGGGWGLVAYPSVGAVGRPPVI